MSCLISYILASPGCVEGESSDKSKIKINVSSRIWITKLLPAFEFLSSVLDHSATPTDKLKCACKFNSINAYDKNGRTCDTTCTKFIVARDVLELSDKICMSYTNVDITFYCIQIFPWTRQTIKELICIVLRLFIIIVCDNTVSFKHNFRALYSFLYDADPRYWQVCLDLIQKWTNDILYIKLSVSLFRIWTQQRN